MDYQVNVFKLLDAEPDYIRLNQAILADKLVEVPGSLRIINYPDDD